MKKIPKKKINTERVIMTPERVMFPGWQIVRLETDFGIDDTVLDKTKKKQEPVEIDDK